MKASELRIGNYIKIDNDDYRPEDTNKIAKVYSISDRGTYGYSIGCRIDEWTEFGQLERYIAPIPLTEEWLLKFGFVYNNEDKAYINSLLWLEKQGDKFGVWKGEYGNNHLRTITYVHQLQNLYHALTGGELIAQ